MTLPTWNALRSHLSSDSKAVSPDFLTGAAPKVPAEWPEHLVGSEHQASELEVEVQRVEALEAFRVLAVEDDPIQAEFIRDALEACGICHIDISTSGEDALQLARRASQNETPKPHLVLLDLCLPKMSGHDVLYALRSDPVFRMIPVVVLSCNDDDISVASCLHAGANAFVPKETTHDEFRAAVARIVDFWRTTRIVAV